MELADSERLVIGSVKRRRTTKKIMTYKVLALKWRPQTFKDLVGQNHVTQTLMNAFEQDRIAQGYLFTGPRGVGKTTTARIFAMALNEEGGPSANFDPNSKISKEIADGRCLDVLEIDGASNRGIDDIRQLREQVKFSPMNSAYKVIIIDEVHMLTKEAFNALLRTLEEPPSHAKFVFATTDSQKVPATIISRCQRFDFNRISLKVIFNRLEYILKEENIESDPESVNAIARKADGSMRDALSLLDQAISFCGNKLSYDVLVDALGLISNDLYFEFTKCIRDKDSSAMIKLLSFFTSFGLPAVDVLGGMGDHVRNLYYAGTRNGDALLEMNAEHKQSYVQEASYWDRRDLLRISQIITDVSATIRRSEDPFLLLEMTALKLLEMDQSVSIEQLLRNEIPSPVSSIGKKSNTESSSSNATENRETNKEIVKEDIEPEKKEKELPSPKTIEADHSLESDNDGIEENPQTQLESIVEHWAKIMEKIHLDRPSVGAVLEECIPVGLSGEILTIKTVGKSSFNVKTMERGAIAVERIISEKLNVSLKIKFENGENSDVKSDPDQQKDNTRSNSRDGETLNRIIEVFDGEILR